jgi:phage/plasmid-like protein (TIGR03299 family)
MVDFTYDGESVGAGVIDPYRRTGEIDSGFHAIGRGIRMSAPWAYGKTVESAMDSRAAMSLSGLDWPTILEPVFSEAQIQIPDKYVSCRGDLPVNDSRRFLGIVGKTYKEIPNVECFAIADAIAGESGARFVTAGSMKNGRVVWLVAQLPDSIEIGDNTANQYLVFRTAHDGTGAVQIQRAILDSSCWNCAGAVLSRMVSGKLKRGDSRIISVRHSTNAKLNIREAQNILAQSYEEFAETGERFNAMARCKSANGIDVADDRWTDAFLQLLWPDQENKNNTRAQNNRKAVRMLFNGRQIGANTQARNGTAWGLYSAVTEYMDHTLAYPERTKRDHEDVMGNRMESILNSTIAEKRQRSFDVINRAYGLDGAPACVDQIIEMIDTAGNPIKATSAADELLGNIAIK